MIPSTSSASKSPIGSGKTALVEVLCKRLRDRFDIFVITNDIYTKEDQLILTRAQALPADRIMGVETGGCPHTAIREDASMNLAAIDEMSEKFPRAELCFIESGGDNLAATFSPELADLMIYAIDVAEGEKIPRKGGRGITRSDLLGRQGGGLLHRDGRLGRRGCVVLLEDAAMGSVKRNMVPQGWLGEARSVPPWASMMDRETARPTPRPLGLVVKKASNSCAILPAGRPTPASATATVSIPDGFASV